MTAVVKKKDDPTKVKGELMESNADAMEVGFFSSFLSVNKLLDKSMFTGLHVIQLCDPICIN